MQNAIFIRRSMQALLAIMAGAALAATIQAAAGADREWGRHLAAECATCHRSGGGRQGGIPAITGLPPDQFAALMLAYKQRQRESPVMQAIAGRLSREEIDALAAHYGRLEAAD